MDFLFEAQDRDRTPFGDKWAGPSAFEPWEETLVATFDTRAGGDGQTVQVFCTATPARFYKLKVLPGENSVGTPQGAYEINTGSGQAELAVKVAEAISKGMLGFEPANAATKPRHE